MAVTKNKLQAGRMLCVWLALAAAHCAATESNGIAPPHYTVLLMPPRHESQDPAARASLAAFHALLLTELRAVPGLELRVADTDSTDAAADYRVTVVSHATVARGGRTQSYSSITRSSGGTLPPFELAGEVWPMEVAVQRNGQWISRGTDHTFFIAKPGTPTPRICAGNASIGSLRTLCMTLPENVAAQVEALRLQDFPPDPTIYLQFAAQVGDASLTERERSTALNRLLNEHRKGRFAMLDAASSASIARFVAAYPAQASRVWAAVRGIPHAALVGALLDSMRADPDWNTRLAALTTLAADDGNERRVREGLASTARGDRNEMLRMVARRADGAMDQWRDYVLASLRKGDLPPAERLVPLLYAAQNAPSPEQQAALAELVKDRKILDEVLTLARNWRSDTSITQKMPIGQALELFKELRDPSVEVLRQDYANIAGQQMILVPGPPREGMPLREYLLMPVTPSPRPDRPFSLPTPPPDQQ